MFTRISTSKRLFFACFLSAVWGVYAPRIAAYAQNKTVAPSAPVQRITRQIARGVELVQEITPEGTPNGPLVVTILRVNPKQTGTRVEAALGQDRVWGRDATMGREVVSTLAVRRGAVAAINAGFFPFAGNPIGLHLENGEIITEPASRRTVFLLSAKGEAQFARFDFKGTAQTPGQGDITITGLNRRAGTNDNLLLYTPVFFDKTLRAPGRVEAILEIKEKVTPNRNLSGRVLRVVENGDAPLVTGTVVLSSSGPGADWVRALRPDAKVTLRLGVETLGSAPVNLSRVSHAVAGGPRLLTDGRVTITLADEGMSQTFSTTRHPRTAVGVTKGGTLLLVTVDGRQKSLSRGASLAELADILLRFGAVNAVNLDGGGSSACVVKGAVVNSPSDGRERSVADMLLVFGTPVQSATAATPTLPPRPLAVGDVWKFGYERLTNVQTAVWGTSGGVGFVSQEGEFRALRPGTGTVTLTVGSNKPVVIPVTVILPSAAAVPATPLSAVPATPGSP